MIKTIATGALLTAAVLLVAPTANASDLTPGLWASIAYSPTTGAVGSVWNAGSEDNAEGAAVQACDQEAGDNSCRAVASGTECVSLATDPDPQNNSGYSGAVGSTEAEADANAMSHAEPAWTIQAHECSAPEYV